MVTKYRFASVAILLVVAVVFLAGPALAAPATFTVSKVAAVNCDSQADGKAKCDAVNVECNIISCDVMTEAECKALCESLTKAECRVECVEVCDIAKATSVSVNGQTQPIKVTLVNTTTNQPAQVVLLSAVASPATNAACCATVDSKACVTTEATQVKAVATETTKLVQGPF